MKMLSKIKVTPLASESLGVRSMCTLVETSDVRVLLDAGVSLAPYRFSLLPHPIEFQTIARLRKRIEEASERAQVVTISHYHFDHHTPSYEDWLVNWTEATESARQIYQDKLVIMKNPKDKINPSQRERAWMFQKTGGRYAMKLSVADGREFVFGETVLRFSEAVSHGSKDAVLGWVVMASIECDGECFMHAPDVQGPISAKTVEVILAEKPDVLMVGGPPFYLGGFKVEEAQIQIGLSNLIKIVESVPLTILEHHALRDAQWRVRAESVFNASDQAGHLLLTGAEYSGVKDVFLESKRKELYAEFPPSAEFEKWTKVDSTELSHAKPPIE
jgi:predicted metallo-beta-lactamase superfamily hydrolase